MRPTRPGPAVLGVVAPLLWGLCAVPAAAQLPPALDADGDGWANTLETALGSEPQDASSQPEHMAVHPSEQLTDIPIPNTCHDCIDNDQDGLIDADDPGCGMPPVFPFETTDLGPGLDAFPSNATISGVEVSGPVVIDRGAAEGGQIPLNMIAMQLRSADGSLVVLEDPDADSPGKIQVLSAEGQPFVASSTFDVSALLLSGGEILPEIVPLTNPRVLCVPPIFPTCHDAVPQQFCYQNPNAVISHCPTWPDSPPVDCPKKIEEPRPILKWVAKFDCGFQPSTPPPYLEAVKPGNYATKIVIHNPQGWPVKVQKKVAVGKRNPRSGRISKFETFTLAPDAATEVDCRDILRLLGQQPPPKGQVLPFFNGVVVVMAERKLDVLGNYTYELAKEKIEFRIVPPPNAPPALKKLANRRLKWVQAVVQELIHDEEEEVRQALRKQFPGVPPAIINRTKIEILGDQLGAGASIDVEAITPQKCLLIDPPEQEWLPWCEVDP